MPTLDNAFGATQLSQRRSYYTGTIPASASSSTGLQSITLHLDPQKPLRRLYGSWIVDDVNGAYLTGSLHFRLGGNPKLSIPIAFAQTLIGWTGSDPSRNCTVPPFSVERWDSTLIPWVGGVPNPGLAPNCLVTAFPYSDGVITWTYRVTMAPLRVVGIFDELLWTPETFYGTANATNVLQVTTLAVMSDES